MSVVHLWGDLQYRSSDMTPGVRVIGSNMCEEEGTGNKAKESPNRGHTEGKEKVMQEETGPPNKQVDLSLLHFVPRRGWKVYRHNKIHHDAGSRADGFIPAFLFT